MVLGGRVSSGEISSRGIGKISSQAQGLVGFGRFWNPEVGLDLLSYSPDSILTYHYYTHSSSEETQSSSYLLQVAVSNLVGVQATEASSRVSCVLWWSLEAIPFKKKRVLQIF